ncbi:MAG TPA: hypothetical protein VGG84_15655 [Gemmatimonadaceae bacterium]
MRSVRLAALAIVALASIPSRPAHAQVTASLAALDSAGDAGILRELERASARGLPAEPLLAKVREGRLKRAGAGRIRGAVVALATRLDSARMALGPRATVEELAAGADALAAGATPTALRALRDASPGRPIGPSLGALAQLVASGVPPRRAVGMITELLRRNVTASQVVAFGNSVEADAAGGVPAEESATFRLHTLGEPGASSAAALASPTTTDAGTITNGFPRVAPATPKRRP